MEREKIHCIACRSELVNIDPEGFQPQRGLAFKTHGHYGSTFFDPMDGRSIEVAVCDACLARAKAAGIICEQPASTKN